MNIKKKPQNIRTVWSYELVTDTSVEQIKYQVGLISFSDFTDKKPLN